MAARPGEKPSQWRQLAVLKKAQRCCSAQVGPDARPTPEHKGRDIDCPGQRSQNRQRNATRFHHHQSHDRVGKRQGQAQGEGDDGQDLPPMQPPQQRNKGDDAQDGDWQDATRANGDVGNPPARVKKDELEGQRDHQATHQKPDPGHGSVAPWRLKALLFRGGFGDLELHGHPPSAAIAPHPAVSSSRMGWSLHQSWTPDPWPAHDRDPRPVHELSSTPQGGPADAAGESGLPLQPGLPPLPCRGGTLA
jgi:hypothetical protein